MAKLIENNEMKGIQLKEGQIVLDVDGNEYLIEKGDVLQERTGDWRLPDKEELDMMYRNLHKKGLGNFALDYYWSSSEDSSYLAWSQYFTIGIPKLKSNGTNARVRIVRSFKSNEDFEIGQETATGFIFDIQGNTVFECKKEDEPKEMSWDEAMKDFGA